jgi:uncharacterized membrane-anchored protein YitT (DUF2179 family)
MNCTEVARYIPGKGMYNNTDKTIIFTVLNRREMAILQEYIHQIDPKLL